jgi:S-adenosylmethionine uptake transporter
MIAMSTQDMLIKWISGAYPLHEVVLARGLVAILLTLFLVRHEGGFVLLRSRRWPLHLLRGLLVVMANMGFFLGLAALPMAEALALFFVAPLFITILSVLILKEKVGPRRWFAVAAGMVGVFIMLRPGDDIFELAALLPMIGAFAYALMQMVTRRLGVTDRASAMSFYIHLTFIIVSLCVGLVAGDGRFAGSGHPSMEFLLRGWVWPSVPDAALFMALGALNATAGYLLTQAYRIAEATVVAPFEYVAMPMAVFWGVLLWGDWPDMMAATGIALIVGSGLFVFLAERTRGRSDRQPNP